MKLKMQLELHLEMGTFRHWAISPKYATAQSVGHDCVLDLGAFWPI